MKDLIIVIDSLFYDLEFFLAIALYCMEMLRCCVFEIFRLRAGSLLIVILFSVVKC